MSTGKSKELKMERAETEDEEWLPFIDAYRTFCLAPDPKAKELLGGIQQFTHLLSQRNNAGTSSTVSL
jgi:hypothetical protein